MSSEHRQGGGVGVSCSIRAEIHVVRDGPQSQGVGSNEGSTQPAWGQSSWRTWPMALGVGSGESGLLLKGSD